MFTRKIHNLWETVSNFSEIKNISASSAKNQISKFGEYVNGIFVLTPLFMLTTNFEIHVCIWSEFRGQILSPFLGDIVDCGIELPYRPARLRTWLQIRIILNSRDTASPLNVTRFTPSFSAPNLYFMMKVHIDINFWYTVTLRTWQSIETLVSGTFFVFLAQLVKVKTKVFDISGQADDMFC